MLLTRQCEFESLCDSLTKNIGLCELLCAVVNG